MLTIERAHVYYGESRILSDVSMEIPSGRVVCLMGRNGVGKTTLLKAVMGVLKTRTGRMVFEGQEITHQPSHKRARSGIGYVPQGRGIFPYLTVYENLIMGLEALTDQRSSAGSIEEMYQLFPILKTMGKRVAGTLSGGQQQQLAIARALVRRPKLLLLDEPTEGIQPSIVMEIERVIESLKQQGQMAILLVEQFLDFALSIADYCYVMEKGTIVSKGPASELNQNVVKEFLAV
jgi:urea transport system ATP-binding protein